MNVAKDRKYSKDHEWVLLDGDTATIGISDHAQEALGAIVFAELPEKGKAIAKGDSFAVLESVKAASSVYAPVSGQITWVNEALNDAPELLNDDPYNQAIIAITPVNEADLVDLMDADAYTAYLDAL